jgi:glycosyltransferase involved in cell wall biosynthesis
VRKPKRILCLHDSPDFGGHERAFLTWLPALLESPDVEGLIAALPEGNTAFAEALEPFAGPKLRLVRSPFVKRRGEPYLAFLRLSYRRWVHRLVRETAPDVVLLLQGRIENLAVPLLAAPRGPELVSYVPMAHSGQEMGRPPLAAWAGDQARRLYYGRPHRFVVPSQAVADQLKRAGARGAVHVVRNVPHGSPAPARSSHPGPKPTILYLGRIERRQKGLDLLLRSMSLARADLGDLRFLFVGDGPDSGWLQRQLDQLPEIESEVRAWTEEPEAILAGAQLLLAPSRFEGVPLVLLEALAAGVPVLASPIDVFREHLPPANLFNFGGPGLADAVKEVISGTGRDLYAAHARRISAGMDLGRSQARFAAAVLGHLVPDEAGMQP